VVDSVRIARVGEEAERYRPTTEYFQELVETAQRRVQRDEDAKRVAEADWIAQHYPELADRANRVRTSQLEPPTAAPTADGPIRIRYRGTMLRYMAHRIGYNGPALAEIAFGSDENGVPGFFDPPREFSFEPGTTTINDGLDSIIAGMAPGERLIAIVPSELGYGSAGLYTPEVPGEPRFVISPNTVLVYEVEALID
jgi:hypothetical protein